MQTTNTLTKNIQAREMLERGFINKIIEIETGLSKKIIRNLRQSLFDEGRIEATRERSIRQGQTLIKKRTDREDASLLMLSYRRLAGDDRCMLTIDLGALIQAFDIYQVMKMELDCRPSGCFTINDAYSLAKELRTGDAYFVTCHCGWDYYISTHQECSPKCPFCLGQQDMRMTA